MPRLTDADKLERRKGIGSSDIPMLLGLSKHGGPFDVFNDKIGIREDIVETEQMALGHELEPFLAAWYERSTGAQLVPGGTFVHPEMAWARATIDFRILGKRETVECKNVGSFMAWMWDPNVDDGVPHSVRAQAVWQAGVAQVDVVNVVAMLGGMQRRVFHVPFDPALWTLMVSQARTMWERIQAQEAPPPDGTSASREYLAVKYPQRDDVIIPLDCAEAAEDAMTYFNAHSREKDAAMFKALATQRMLARIGEHAGAECKGVWRFTAKAGKTGKRTVRWTDLREGEGDE